MICFKCQSEIPDESVFCPKCGNRLTVQAAGEVIDASKSKRGGFKWIIIILAAIACIALIAVVGVLVSKHMELERKVEEFQQLIETQEYASALKCYEEYKSEPDFVERADKDVIERYEKAVSDKDDKLEVALFNSGLLTQDYVAELEKSIKAEIDGIKERFLEEGGTVKEFKNEVKKYLDYKNKTIADMTADANKEMMILIKSRASYRRGEQAEGKKEYANALANYSKVVEEDIKYSDAQSRIGEIVPLYKKEVMDKVEKSLKDKDYEPAIKEIQTLIKYCPDSDVTSKLGEVKKQKAAYDEEQKQIKMKEFKDTQEVEVVSAEALNQGYYVTLMNAKVIIKNNTDKVAKDVRVGILCFDANGYPVEAYLNLFYDNQNLQYCNYTTCNIQPGDSYGSEWVVRISDKCRKVKACVDRVTYTNGTFWDNPYFDYWLEENKAAY